ncbi:MAG: hypothetical protein A2X66_04410 [Ignavibacteria bacterium GWA2_54_16]|nr:MAG: hypothetical protein A2X66_04410 [Ignavibacteria bacterium GWA2_54_16]
MTITSTKTIALLLVIACRKTNNLARVLGLLLVLLYGGAVCVAQPKTKAGVKFGLELGEYLSKQSGSFQKRPGYTVGLFTGIGVLADAKRSLSLGLELNFVKLIHYRPGHEILSSYDNTLYRFILDQNFEVASVEAGLVPTLSFSINQQMSISVYVGPSFGIGKLSFRSQEISRAVVDSAYHPSFEGVYGAYSNGLNTLTCFNMGVSWWCRDFLIDMRYKYSHIGERGEINDFENFYLHVGLTLLSRAQIHRNSTIMIEWSPSM